MTSSELLIDAFTRVRGVVHAAVDGLSEDDLAHRPDGQANSIAWLVWHLSRVQDDHVAGVAGTDQVWLADGWSQRCALPCDDHAIGYGQSSDDVAAVQASGELLTGYHDAVFERTVEYVR